MLGQYEQFSFSRRRFTYVLARALALLSHLALLAAFADSSFSFSGSHGLPWRYLLGELVLPARNGYKSVLTMLKMAREI